MAALLLLSACTGDDPAPTPSATASETATPEPTTEPTTAPPVFLEPADCTTILPEARIATFTAAGLQLLGGPGGLYPMYYADPTPQESAGGISCIWGDESAPGSNIEVSVAQLSPSTRSIVIEDLIDQGLNEGPLEDGISYAQLGDQSSAPAVLNVIRNDSWISVIEGLGGQAAFEEAVAIADEVHSQVYVAP